MKMDHDTEALLTALEADPTDPVTRSAVADLCEERGLQEEAQTQRVYARLHGRINNLLGDRPK